MKIAVVEWFPRVCGVHAWALNIATGLEAIGHAVDRVTFSKSGRPLSAWGGLDKHWQVYRQRDAVDVLDRYDLIVLSDVVCRAPALWKTAHREGVLPWFVAAMHATRTPWTSMAHDACHKTELDPTAAALMQHPNFTGVLLTTVRDDVAERFGKLGGPIHWVQDPFLPYARPVVPVRTTGRDRSAILTARLASNKGQDFLFNNLPALGFDIHLWGDNPYGFPSLAWSMWEKAQANNWDLVVAPKLVGNHTHPNAVKFYTGEFAVRALGNLFHYHGPFADQADIDWSPWLGLNLTNATMRGHLEYAQLDMIAAGCVVAAPEHALRAPSGGPRYYDNVIPLPYVSRKESEAGPVLDLIRGTLVAGEDELLQKAEALQAELTAKHNPGRVAQHFIDGVECYRRPSNYVVVPATPAKEEDVEIEDLIEDVPLVECTAIEDDVQAVAQAVDRAYTDDPTAPLDNPPLLVINTYGGSLLVGAKMAGVPVAASYEDVGFGQEHAKANFPEIPMIAQSKDWPAQDLSNKMVIAHPPCAAFSIQAKGSVLKGNERRAARGEANADRHGLNSDHFKCTTAVINYTLGQRARALAIESVPGALEGARSYHDRAGEEYGYHVYRILQNAATFGVPQWRPRYWTIYIRKDVGDRFGVWHEPKCISIGQLLDSHDPGPSDAQFDRYLDFQRKALADAGYPADELLSTPGMLMSTLQHKYGLSFDEVAGPPRKKGEPNRGLIVGSYDGTEYGERRGPQLGYRFVSKTARVLDPDDCAGVILGDTWFVYKNRNVTPEEYRAIMGFPRDYKLDRTFRLYLSKGVVPAVAKWIIELMKANVEGAGFPPAEAVYWMKPGETADFKPSSEEWSILAGVPLKDGTLPTDADRARLLVGGRWFRPRSAAIESDPNLIPIPPMVKRLVGPGARVVDPVPAPETPVSVPQTALKPPAATVPTPAPVVPPPTAPKGGKKKRVVGRYELRGAGLEPAALQEAFASTRALLPPLAAIESASGGMAMVVVQYEPPNAGGNRTDVDRIVMRAAKKLSAEWRRA